MTSTSIENSSDHDIPDIPSGKIEFRALNFTSEVTSDDEDKGVEDDVKTSSRWKIGPGVVGRRRVRGGGVGMGMFCDIGSDDDEVCMDDDEEERAEREEEDRKARKEKLGYEGRGRRARHGSRKRIARPKDAMPGYRKRRRGQRGGGGGRLKRMKMAGNCGVGKKHLDRGVTLGQYHNGDVGGGGGEESEEDLEGDEGFGEGMDVPVCLGHGMPCERFVVRKKGANKGRGFFKCAEAKRYKQCEFFVWEDEVVEVNDKDEEDKAESILCVAKPVFDEEDLEDALTELTGYTSFKAGQKQVIESILENRSTLAVLPTGGGKSLCYQVAASLLPGTAVVISPLLSLMADQLESLPEKVIGACLRSGQTFGKALAVEKDFREGKLKVLFVSPERFLSERFQKLLRFAREDDADQSNHPVSFFVIDEAHCMSEWSHNFRVAYLRLADSLKRFNRPILCLTATASSAVVKSITSCLYIEDEDVIRTNLMRKNIELSVVSCEKSGLEKTACLLQELKRKEFVRHVTQDNNTGCLIIYTATQRECKLVVSIIRGGVSSVRACMYHAGLKMKERQSIEARFRKGQVDIIVATIAFGLGIDRANVRGVIHWGLPSSLEAYAQEVGRAGRDDKPAWCTVLLTEEDKSFTLSRAHVDGIDLAAVSNLLRLLTEQIPIQQRNLTEESDILSLYVSHEKVIRKLDMSIATAETICGYLESLVPGVTLGKSTYMDAKVQFFTRAPHELASVSCPDKVPENARRVCSIIDKGKKQQNGTYTLDLREYQSEAGDVMNGLKALKSAKHITYNLIHEALVVRIPLDDIEGTAKQITASTSKIHEKLKGAEQRNRARANCSIETLSEASKFPSRAEQSEFLHERLADAFENSEDVALTIVPTSEASPPSVSETDALRAATLAVVKEKHGGRKPTNSRQVARILHGLSGPAFRTRDWCQCAYWGRFRSVDFESVMEIVRKTLRDLKLGRL